MNRREHYEEAERLLADIKTGREHMDGRVLPADMAHQLQGAFQLQALIAGVHASLSAAPAEVAGEERTGVSPERSSCNVAMDLIHEAEEATARAESAEADRDALRAGIEAMRRVVDDELANLADDGARPSHAVVRRMEAALASLVPGDGR